MNEEWTERTGPPPMPVRASVMATVRNDEPVAVLTFTDAMGESRVLHLGIDASWTLMHGLVAFLHLATKP